MAIYRNPATGKTVNTGDIKGGRGNEVFGFGGKSKDGYKFNNAFRWGIDKQDFEHVVQYIMENGYDYSDSSLQSLRAFLNSKGKDLREGQVEILLQDAETFLANNNVNIQDLTEYYAAGGTYENPEGLTTEDLIEKNKADARAEAENYYFNTMSAIEDPNDTGLNMLDRYTTAEQNAAMSNMQLAEAQYQQAAMQQAEVVKNITDQVKSERMARLRAGMSESQIANQDMQILLNNVNSLNQQMNTMNSNQLAAQQQYALAQDTAYQQYINSATNLGSVGAAYAAAGAGDAYLQTKLLQSETGTSFNKNHDKATGK